MRKASLLVVMLAAVSQVIWAAQEQGLVAHWDFGEGKGDVLHDRSGNNNHGKIHGAKWVKYGEGHSLQFDGKGDYVDCGDNPRLKLSGDMTISAWVKLAASPCPDAHTNWYIIDCEEYEASGFMLRIDGAKLKPTYRSSQENRFQQAFPREHLENNTFCHLGVVKKGNTAMYFIDGERDLQFPVESPGPGTVPFKISTQDQSFHGLMHDLRIYSRALSEEEMARLYNSRAHLYPKDPMALRLFYAAGTPTIVVNLDLARLRPLPARADVGLWLPGEAAEALKTTSVDTQSLSHKGRVTFTMPDLPAGQYEVRVVLTDAKAAPVKPSLVRTFDWPKRPAWLGSREGISDNVLSPWTPVVVKRDRQSVTASVWDRAYTFDGLPFPSAIASGGKNLLAGSVRIVARQDKGPVMWREAFPQVGEETPARASLSWDASSTDGALSLSAVTEIEYDGMVRVDWKLTANREVKLEALSLEIPVPAELARYLYYFPTIGKEWLEGTCGWLPEKGKTMGFTPAVWLGDEARGLQWFAESDFNWYNADADRAIEIIREGKAVILRLHLVTTPVQLAPARPQARQETSARAMASPDAVPHLSYTFGLQATPLKPWHDPWDDHIITSIHYAYDYKVVEEKTPDGRPMLDHLAELGVKTIVICNWTGILCYSSPTEPEKLRGLVEACHKRGIGVIPYFGYHMSELAPEFSLFHGECSRHPSPGEPTGSRDGYPGGPMQQVSEVCMGSAWQDLVVDGIAKLMDNYGLDGVYLDGTGDPKGCLNVGHGCGYVRLDGTPAKTYPVFACRETLRRIYTAVKSRKPDGLVDFHQSGHMVAPVLAWATTYWDGEQLHGGVPKGSFALDRLPLDLFRAEFMGRPWGVPAEFLAYCLGKSTGCTWTQAHAITLLHDVAVRPHGSLVFTEEASALWKVMAKFGHQEAEWLPYWKNSEYVKVSPEGAYVSLYRHPRNGVLAVVSNLGKQEALVNVQLDPARLGLRAPLSARDALSEAKLPIANAAIELSLPSLGWKVIWIRGDGRKRAE